MFIASGIYGQSYSLEIRPADSAELKFMKRLNFKAKHHNSLSAHKELNHVLQYYYAKGYITASIDSLREDSSGVVAWLYTGEMYNMSVIRPGNIDPLILSQSAYKEKLYTGRPFNHKEITRLTTNIIRYCENNGYPFASVRLDSVSIGENNNISSSLNLKLNQKVSIDTIIIKGNSKIHMKFITNYFGIKAGNIYNESKIKRIENKLQDLPFVSVIKPFEVVFIADKVSVILYLDKKQASQFDGIIGIAPNDQTTGKLLLTGDVKLKLMSAFNRGELIDFNWRKLEAKSQDLKFHFNFPFLFSSPFGIDYYFHLYKKDTSFLTLTNNLGIQVLFNGYNHIKAFYENQQSNLLSTSGLEFATTLPAYADISSSLYGIGIDFNKLNYRYNPRSGYRFDLSGAIGLKKIRKNQNVNQALYDSIPLSSTLYRLRLDAEFFIPLFQKSTLLIGNKSGYLENENLFDNELFRIGGLKTLRGFDEESITASLYSIFTLEFRYLFDVNSFFQVFFDGSFYERNSSSGYISDTPLGFGAGLSFETPAGIFAFSYALGSQRGQPAKFRTSKIHFGLTAKF